MQVTALQISPSGLRTTRKAFRCFELLIESIGSHAKRDAEPLLCLIRNVLDETERQPPMHQPHLRLVR